MQENTDDPADPRSEASRTMWTAVSPAWDERAEEVDEHGAPVTDALLDAAALNSGERVLELAGGPGGVGLAAARRVGPDGEVLITDIAEAMVAIAARRAATAGLDQVRTAVMGVDRLDVPDAAFDAVLSREGLMFAADPAVAVAEMARVLRPGGRVAVAVWGDHDANPWLASLLDTVSAQIGMPVPPPGVPGPFALADREELAALFTGVGLADVVVRDVAVPSRAASFADWWSARVALAGPVGSIVGGMAEQDVDAMQTRLRVTLEPYRVGAGYEVPGLSLVASARR